MMLTNHCSDYLGGVYIPQTDTPGQTNPNKNTPSRPHHTLWTDKHA